MTPQEKLRRLAHPGWFVNDDETYDLQALVVWAADAADAIEWCADLLSREERGQEIAPAASIESQTLLRALLARLAEITGAET